MPTPNDMRTKRAENFLLGILDAEDVLASVVLWMAEKMDPEEVFTYQQLESWATNHGYRRERET